MGWGLKFYGIAFVLNTQNQLGFIWKGLVSFMSRLRPSITGACNPQTPQLQGIGGVPMIKQSTVLTPDLLIIDFEVTCGGGGALTSSTK